jgi:hypothetical protein
VNAVTVTAAGALAIVAGTPGEAFGVRGAAGGAPYIPVDSIQIAEVGLTDIADAPVTAMEIGQIPGLHQEVSYAPVYMMHYATGEVEFAQELLAIHTGDVPRKIYIKGAVPIFAPLQYVTDWSPSLTTYSTSSTATFDGPVGSSSSSVGGASFEQMFKQPETLMKHPLYNKVGENLWFRYRPNKSKEFPAQYTQGIFSYENSYPAEGELMASCTVSPFDPTYNKLS